MTTTATKTNALAAALVAAQSEMPEIPKDGTGKMKGVSKKTGKPYEIDYTYATLPMIFRKVLPVLHKHGLALTQTSEGGCLITALRHESGECLLSSLEMPSPRNLSPQEYGIAHSYYRRYETNGMLGLAPDDDTDAAGVDAPEALNASVGSDPPPPLIEAEKTANFHAAVDALIERGCGAIAEGEGVSADVADAEMSSRTLTVLGHEGYEAVSEITARQARVDFYNALSNTVEALEAKASDK